jgi:hypothetical protein
MTKTKMGVNDQNASVRGRCRVINMILITNVGT